MKKIIPLLLLSTLSLTGCSVLDVLQNAMNNLGSEESAEPGEPSDNIDLAIQYMNAYNYHMEYKIISDYEDTTGENTSMPSMTVGPYKYDIDLPRVHVTGPLTMDEYFNVNDYNFQYVVRYSKDSDGNWVTSIVDLTQEVPQVKYFDQVHHNVSDYVRKDSEGKYEMVPEKLSEFGFSKATLQLEGGKGVTKIIIDTWVERMEDQYISRAHLHADLTQFGEISVTLPQVI